MDRTIDFAIIGAQKAGTTSLLEYLRQHPDIFFPELKELNFFVRDDVYAEGQRSLDAFYAGLGSQRLVGAAQVHMMVIPESLDRFYAHNPQARVMAILRHPVDRAYSAYWFARRRGTERCQTFEQALELEPQRAGGSYQERTEFTYLGHGHYHEQLMPWVERFGRERVLVLLQDDLKADAQALVARVVAWLGLHPLATSLDLSRKNVAGLPRHAWLARLLVDETLLPKRVYRKLVSPRVRLFFRARLLNPLRDKNVSDFRYPPMDPATRQRLLRYFNPHNQRLSRLLDRDLSAWDR